MLGDPNILEMYQITDRCGTLDVAISSLVYAGQEYLPNDSASP